jgi:hypothetical protein
MLMTYIIHIHIHLLSVIYIYIIIYNYIYTRIFVQYIHIFWYILCLTSFATHMHTHTCIHTHMHTHTCIHTCIHTHAYTYAHMYIYIDEHTDNMYLYGCMFIVFVRHIYSRHILQAPLTPNRCFCPSFPESEHFRMRNMTLSCHSGPVQFHIHWLGLREILQETARCHEKHHCFLKMFV